jgi:hypothetical protein
VVIGTTIWEILVHTLLFMYKVACLRYDTQVLDEVCKLCVCNGYLVFLDLGKTAQ